MDVRVCETIREELDLVPDLGERRREICESERSFQAHAIPQ